MGVTKRLKAYIKDDRPLKLKSFTTSHDIRVRKIKLSHGRSLLHYCAEFGSPEMLRCLLNLQCDPRHQDNAGRLSLHVALYRALGEDFKEARETYLEIVCPLLEVYPMGEDVEDLNMKTGHDLLTSLKEKLRPDMEAKKKRLKEEEDEHMEENWRQKLAEEYQFEMEEQQSRYNSVDDFNVEEAQETFSAWQDRMYHEYASKHSRNFSAPRRHGRKRKLPPSEPSNSNESKASKKTPQEESDEKLKGAREEMKKRYRPPPCENLNGKLLSQKKIYESKYSRFALHIPTGKSVTYGSVPWPCLHIDQLVDVLFCDFKDKDSPEYKKYLRAQRVRWHPDKFFQLFGNHLHPDHVSKIMARVNAISQNLNALSH